MFSIEWTPHEPKPRHEIDELYAELLESIEVDGPNEFATLVCAAQLLETGHALARLVGFTDREPPLSYADVVELFLSLDQALEALAARRNALIELYPDADTAQYLVLDAAEDPVRLYRVPWRDALALDPHLPLPQRVTELPAATCERDALIGHLTSLRRSFARNAIAADPRLADHEPLRRWSARADPV